MKRRDFFGKSGCGALGMMLAYFGLTSCKKNEDTAEETEAQSGTQAPAQEALSARW